MCKRTAMSVRVTRHTSCTRSDSRCAICATAVTEVRPELVRMGDARIEEAPSIVLSRRGSAAKTEARGAGSALPLPRRRGSSASRSGVAAIRARERGTNVKMRESCAGSVIAQI